MSQNKRFLNVVKNLPEDFAPYGNVERVEGDCSSGCKHFNPIHDDEIGGADMDWGVCTNEASHRKGMLTFEHQGCGKFEKDGVLS